MDLFRICLVLECLQPHDYASSAPRTRHLANLQHHVIREKRLDERQALAIFYRIAEVS